MTITLEEYKKGKIKGKIAINTRTKEEYDNLMRFFDENSLTWGNDKISTEGNNLFSNERDTFIIITHYNNNKIQILRCDEGYKIITPNQLKEYNEFIGKSKYITTHAELLKLHGRSITCKIGKNFIEEAKISVNKKDNDIFICQNIKPYGVKAEELFGYADSYGISFKDKKYEVFYKHCTEIKLKEEYLTKGQAIDYMLESEDNVIEFEVGGNLAYIKIKNKLIYIKNCENWILNQNFDGWMGLSHIIKWKNIKKHIGPEEPKQDTICIDEACKVPDNIDWNKVCKELKKGKARFTLRSSKSGVDWRKYLIEEPKQKTLKEKMEAKEPFTYKDKQYRFDKNGAIITQQGHNVSLDKIKELLKQCEE